MPSFVQAPASPALARRLQELADLPSSRRFGVLRGQVQSAVLKGAREGILAGTDGRGRALVPLKAPRKGKYQGATGPPLAPFGARSRSVANMTVDWRREGANWVLVQGWRDIEARGRPFFQYHLTGTRSLPKRDVAGIRPRDWAVLRRLFADFLARIGRSS